MLEKEYKDKIKENQELVSLRNTFKKLDELTNISGTKAKQAYLAHNQDYDLYRVLLFLLDPDFTTNVRKSSLEKENDLKNSDIDLFKDQHLFEVLNYLNNKKSANNEDIISIQKYLNELPTDLKDGVKRLIIKDYKTGLGQRQFLKLFPTAFDNRNELMFLGKHKVMKGKLFEEKEFNKRLKNKKVYITEKLDGVRAQVYVNPETNEILSMTRQGKVLNYPEIEPELLLLAKEINKGVIMFDGEVLLKNFNKKETESDTQYRKRHFNETRSFINSDQENVNLKMNIFDYLLKSDSLDNENPNLTKTPYSDRYEVLKNKLSNNKYEFLDRPKVYLENEEIKDVEWLIDLKEKIHQAGKEGIMINISDALYNFKSDRTYDIMKVKKAATWDLKCVGYNMSKISNKEHLIATYTVEICDKEYGKYVLPILEKKYNKILKKVYNEQELTPAEQKKWDKHCEELDNAYISTVNIRGFSKEYQDEEIAKTLIGKIIEVKFTETSRSKTTGKLSLSHPSFVRVRDDKTKPSQD